MQEEVEEEKEEFEEEAWGRSGEENNGWGKERREKKDKTIKKEANFPKLLRSLKISKYKNICRNVDEISVFKSRLYK